MKLHTSDTGDRESGVTTLTEYMMITSLLVFLLVVIMFSVNASFIENPTNKVMHHAFIDIGNGISARIVDIYVVSPYNGTVDSGFDIPDDVMGKDYFVDVKFSEQYQQIVVSRNIIESKVSLAGIGATKGVVGNTTGRGWNKISYDYKGY
jgi:hypothetical protein